MSIFKKTKAVQTDRVRLKVTGRDFNGHLHTFALNGQIVPVNAIVEVSASEAQDLKARALAVDATEAEVTAAGTGVIVGPDRNDKWRDVT